MIDKINEANVLVKDDQHVLKIKYNKPLTKDMYCKWKLLQQEVWER